MSLDPFKPYADLLKAGAVLLLATILAFSAWKAGAGKWEGKYDVEVAAHKATKAAHAATLGELASKTAAVAAKAKAASTQVQKDRRRADEILQETKHAAQRRETDLVAALRRGEQRLQERWACDLPGPAAGGTAGDGREADPAGRFDSAARIVGAADVDAAVIDWLWASWKADRQAVVAAGCAIEAP